jgi:hypothetical protein
VIDELGFIRYQDNQSLDYCGHLEAKRQPGEAVPMTKQEREKELRRIRTLGVVRSVFRDQAGNVVVTDDSAKPYLLRVPNGYSAHATIRRFMRVKPRYERIGNLIVMRKRRARGVKSGNVCPVVEFPI